MWLASAENPLPGLQKDAFLLCPHKAERDHLSHVSSCKDTNSVTEALILMTSSKHNYLPKAPPPNTITLRVGASIYDFWKNINIQSTIAFVCLKMSVAFIFESYFCGLDSTLMSFFPFSTWKDVIALSFHVHDF